MIRLIVYHPERGYQQPLAEHARIDVVLPDYRVLVTLTGEFVRHLIEHHLGLAAIMNHLPVGLDSSGRLMRRPLASAPRRALPWTTEQRQARRVARASRGGKRRARE